MRIDVFTLFPGWFDWFTQQRHVRNALDLGNELAFVDLRATTPVKAGQVDDTPAHAIERLYFHVCERAGYAWMKIADPALLFDTSAVVRIGAPGDLARFAEEHGVSLTSGTMPRRAEAPPMMVRVPAALRSATGQVARPAEPTMGRTEEKMLLIRPG